MKVKPGDRLGMRTGDGTRTVGIRKDGSWCYESRDGNPNSCGGGRRAGLPLCAACGSGVYLRDGCQVCGN